MVPVVTLVRRPNIGKSTLFNHLTHTQDALVADFPGLTHDHKYSHAEIEGHEFICIDTSRIDGTEDSVETHMAEQSLLAIEEADIILFMVDARTGLMPADEAIAKHLRSHEKPTFLVANKTDSLDPNQAVVDFYSLGLGEIYPITTSHSHGILSLLEHVLLPWMEDLTPQEEVNKDTEYWAQFEAEENSKEEEEDNFNPQSLPIKLAIVGHPNIGKSTLTNHILGEEHVVVYNMPGTTRDSIYIPMEHNGHEYVLIDTTGIHKHSKITNAVEKFSIIKTLQAIEDTNMVMLVIDAHEGISNQDLSLLGFILNSGHSLVIVVNKWDGLSQEVKEQVKETLDFHLGFINFAHVHFISALHSSGVGNLFESVHEAYDSSTHHVGTSMLTRIMTMAVEDHQPPLVHSHHVKLKYAHTSGYNPPIVVIHSNQVKDLPDSYKHYLMNYFHKSLDIMGSPIHIQFKEGENPYANKHNTLTPTQMHKHKHLMKHIKKNK